jgi:predicted DNA-binding WGR domain protein
MSIEPMLFDVEALVRNWGRIGTRGRYSMDLFEDRAAAASDLGRLARIKFGRATFQCLTRSALVKPAGRSPRPKS